LLYFLPIFVQNNLPIYLNGCLLQQLTLT
jgi:hypothetical protein